MLQVMGVTLAALVLDGIPAGAGSLSGGPIPTEALRRAADRYNGSYVAKWVDSTGKRGAGTGKLAIDPNARTARGSVGFDGKILGRTGLSKQSLTLDLAEYGYDAQTASVARTPVGAVQWERVTDGARLTLSDVPGLAAGSKLDIIGRFTAAGFASFTYTISPRAGEPVRGAVNLGRDAAALPEPVVPAATAAASADILSGAYACDLISKAAATKAFAEPAKEPEANGGRIGYGPGIDTSNCRIETVSGNQLLQMTVYHGRTADAAAAHFALNQSIGTPVPGLESRAYSFVNGRYVWVATGNDIVELQVLDQRSSEIPPALGAFTQLVASRPG